MISIREAIAGAVLIAVVGIASIFLVTYLSINGISEKNDTITATRVAHYETKAELADTLTELSSTLIELHECKNK